MTRFARERGTLKTENRKVTVAIDFFRAKPKGLSNLIISQVCFGFVKKFSSDGGCRIEYEKAGMQAAQDRQLVFSKPFPTTSRHLGKIFTREVFILPKTDNSVLVVREVVG